MLLAALAWLSPASAATTTTTTTERNGMLIFAPGSVKLEAESLEVIERLTMLAKADAANRILLEACGEDNGSRAMNLALHQQRFDIIEQEIIARGIQPHRVRSLSSRELCDTALRENEPSVAARVEKPAL